jgi:hypothetical protein
VAVLKINFQEHLNGPEKIERGEFAIQDATTRKEIDLTGNWESCFLPGQRVEMCMVYLIQEERSASKVERCKMCEPHSPCNLRWMKSISDGYALQIIIFEYANVSSRVILARLLLLLEFGLARGYECLRTTHPFQQTPLYR